ncbi:MAG: preprotein translocase subunit SecG [Phycisphaerae bacterium]|nr:preprotein translocase subunit SecG [Phycisphaerae bacterium]
MTAFFYITEVLFVIVCVFLVLLILIQKGRGGGLASAFGGAGGQTAFGSKTGDVLTWATSVVFGIFLVLAVVLNLIANHIDAARGGSTVAVANTPAKSPVQTPVEQTSLPQPPPPEPGIPTPEPGTPAPNATPTTREARTPSVLVPSAPTVTIPTALPTTRP